ncbi:DUF6220 domain-containing protein [Pelatocladus sp. BLCC-F211]|uniref:DUF6220 domain-containing protein n=1 Tax=Pelatocladus sp. BLCC-F211 TaxID=3342752 RepID=UPI0035BA5979
MAISSSSNTVRTSTYWIQIAFFSVVVLFNICLNLQVLTVGLAYFYDPEWWKVHVWLVRGYSGLTLLLLGLVFLSPFPKRVRGLTISMPVLLALQFITIHLNPPLPLPLSLSVLHPLIGFSLFSASTTLVHRTQHFIFPKPDDESDVNLTKF